MSEREEVPELPLTIPGVSVSSPYEDTIEPSPVQSAEEPEFDKEDDDVQAVTDSDPYDVDTDLDAGRNAVHAPKERLSSKPKVNRVLRPRITKKTNKTIIETYL